MSLLGNLQNDTSILQEKLIASLCAILISAKLDHISLNMGATDVKIKLSFSIEYLWNAQAPYVQ